MRPHNPIKRAKISLWSIATRLRGRRAAHLLHIPKTGGTALKHALHDIHRLGDGFELVLHSHKTRLVDIPRGDAVFFCCRDPISRYQSGFLSRQRQGQPRNLIPWSEGEHLAFSRFTDPAELAEALASDDPQTREEAELAFNRIGHINTPLEYWLQSEALLEQRSRDIVWIGSQSELDDDFTRLAEVLGFPPGLRLPHDAVMAHRNPLKIEKPLSSAARNALSERFKGDSRLFEWCLRHRSTLMDAKPDGRP